LTGAQFGVPGLAVSIAWSEPPVPWETPAGLAADLLEILVGDGAPSGPVVFNLNVPALTWPELRGVAHGHLGSAGLIRGVRPEATPDPVAGPAVDRTGGAVVLNLRGQPGADRAAEEAELAAGSDAALVAAGWASLTPLLGVREDRSPEADALVDAGLERLGAPRRSEAGNQRVCPSSQS
jgi:5'-nucleotidase